MTITAADYGALGAVTETLPAGFGCVSSGLDDEEVQATGQHLRFTRQGDSPSRYIVNAPSEEGAYSSSGMLRDSDWKDTPIGGASWGRATVQQPSNPGPPVRPPNNPPTFPVEAAAVFAGVTGGFSLSLTTTILPEHPGCCPNGEYGTPLFEEHFPFAGTVP